MIRWKVKFTVVDLAIIEMKVKKTTVDSVLMGKSEIYRRRFNFHDINLKTYMEEKIFILEKEIR
jgi:hypothetical protein